MKIVADDKIPFLKGVLEPFADVRYLPGLKIGRQALTDAEALIIRTRTKVTKELLAGTPVRFIATATIGYDHLDIRYMKKQKIYWTSAPGCNSSSVTQYMASTLVRLAQNRHFSFNNMTLGIIGVGHVGSKVARMAKSLGFRVLLNDPPRQRKERKKDFISLRQLIAESDLVTLHVPLNKKGRDKTLGMVNRNFLNSMKKGAILINSSRGPIVDEQSLKEVLKNGYLSGAALDVWNNEPYIDRELLQMADIATPHIAGYSVDGKANGTAMSVRALSRFFGFPLQEWFPRNLPAPEEPVIRIDNTRLNHQEAISFAIHHTYPIEHDDKNLRENPDIFEKLREDYLVRRESANYSVELQTPDQLLTDKFKELGFNILTKNDYENKS